MKRLRIPQECAGLTVSEVCVLEYSVAVHFTDGSVIVWEADVSTGDEDAELSLECRAGIQCPDIDLLRLKVIDDVEYSAYSDRIKLDRDKQLKAQRRAKYEELKKEFEP